MKNLKKIIMIALCFIFGLGAMIGFSGCTDEGNGKIKIVCTIAAEKDWTEQIIKGKEDEFNLKILLNNGTDMHSYEPTVADIAKVATADIFIYVGGESDEWVDKALKNATNKEMKVINLIEVLGDRAKEEEHVEGMEEENHEEEVEIDEHVWLSLKNVKIFVQEITKTICQLDSDNSNLYNENSSEYCARIDNLDQQYQIAAEQGNKNTLVFGDRFPFRYLVDDYNLNYYAAFSGCSAETEASFETIIFLAEKVDEFSLNVILKIETSDGSVAQTIKNNTRNKNQKVLTLNSLQSYTAQKGKSYLDIMEENLLVLKEALN